MLAGHVGRLLRRGENAESASHAVPAVERRRNVPSPPLPGETSDAAPLARSQSKPEVSYKPLVVITASA
jgi:hypothetical protein